MKHLLLALFLLFTGCNTSPPVIDPACTVACRHRADLGCHDTTPAGKPCVDWCSAVSRTPAGVNADCMARAPTCNIDACGR